MKKFLTRATVGLLVGGVILSAVAGGPDLAAPMITPGLYAGIGGAYNSIYSSNSYAVNLHNFSFPGNVLDTSVDSYNVTETKFAPVVQVGYWAPIDSEWLWGAQASYKYLNYTTSDVLNTVPNATGLTSFPAGTNALNAARARSTFEHELLLLAYGGVQFDKGYAYLGVGAVMFTVKNFFGYNVNAAVPGSGSGVGHQFTNFQETSGNIWGGALQVGYNYYFKPDWFLGLNYTYAMTGTYTDTNNGYTVGFLTDGTNAGSTTPATVARKVRLEAQEFMFTVNKVFEM